MFILWTADDDLKTRRTTLLIQKKVACKVTINNRCYSTVMLFRDKRIFCFQIITKVWGIRNKYSEESYLMHLIWIIWESESWWEYYSGAWIADDYVCVWSELSVYWPVTDLTPTMLTTHRSQQQWCQVGARVGVSPPESSSVSWVKTRAWFRQTLIIISDSSNLC